MQYLQEAVQSIVNVKEAFSSNDNLPLNLVLATCYSAHKMVIPSPSRVRVTVTPEVVGLVKMPWPEILMEYWVDNASDQTPLLDDSIPYAASSKRILLVVDLHKSTTQLADVMRGVAKSKGLPVEGAILVTGIFYSDKENQWVPTLGAAIWHPSMATPDFRISDVNYCLSFEPTPVYPDLFIRHIKSYGEGKAYQIIMNDLIEEVATAIKAIVVLNAKNVAQVELTCPESITKMNKKRRASGKPPFHRYSTVDVFIGGRKEVESKKMSLSKVVSFFNHATGLHTVRGHFKVRSSGIYWWSHHVRGNKASGLVNSTHKLKED